MSRILSSVYNSLPRYLITKNICIRTMGFYNQGDRLIKADMSNVGMINERDRLNDPWYLQRPVLFLHDQEPVFYVNHSDRWSMLRFYTEQSDRRMILLHSEKNSLDVNRLCSTLDVVPCYWFSNAALAMEWYQNEQWSINIDAYIRDNSIPQIKYKFSCFNRLISNQRIYRSVLSSFLLDTVDHRYLRLSCSTVDPSNHLPANKQTGYDLPQRHLNAISKFDGESMPVLVNINKDDLDEKGQIANSAAESGNDYFLSTFCHIVTETLFYENTLHLTEKSFRPIVNKRPFVLAGPPGSLKYLRSYGFRTFSEFWDESYDDEVDGAKRLDMIMKLVSTLNEMSLDEMEVMLRKMHAVLEHNFNHFYNEFEKIVKDELIHNLDQAIIEFNRKSRDGWLKRRLNDLSDEEVARMVSSPAPGSAPIEQVWAEVGKGNHALMDQNLHDFLVKIIGASKEDTKETLLTKMDQILD